jgi:hypothetical protein
LPDLQPLAVPCHEGPGPEGRLILDEATFGEEERRRLDAALAESEDDVAAGRVRPAVDFLGDLNRHQ